MVKLNLSAIQNTPVSNNSIPENTDISKQDIPEPTISAAKKKMSLNSLISGVQEEKNDEEIEPISNSKIETLIIENIIEEKKDEEEKKINLNLSSESKENNAELNTKSLEEEKKDEEKSEDLVNKEEENTGKIEETPNTSEKNQKDESNVISISDGDTIGNLLTEINKEEMFGSYVSAFDKEIQALKNKNKKSNKKEEIKETIKKEEALPIIEKKDLDLDKLIEEVKSKEETINEEEISTPIKSKLTKEEKKSQEAPLISEEDKKKKKIQSKKIFIVLLSILILSAIGFVSYRIFDKKIDNQNQHIDTNNMQVNNNSGTFSTGGNITNTGNIIKVNQKLIKHFKNKRNSDKIETNKN